MNKILADTEGAVCLIDDIFVYGKSQLEDDQHLLEAGLTLNKKCVFNTTSIKFLGQLVDSTGVKSRSKQDSGHTGTKTSHKCKRAQAIPRHGQSAKQVCTEPCRRDQTLERAIKHEESVEMGCSTRTSF